MCCDKNRWRFFCLLRIIQESGAYQLRVPQGQGDSSAHRTTEPLICGFCLATTPNTRCKTVQQSIVTWMFAREFITNHHPVAPQLTNKPCTNGHIREKHKCVVIRIDEDFSAYSELFKRVEWSVPTGSTAGSGWLINSQYHRRTDRRTDTGNGNTSSAWKAKG